MSRALPSLDLVAAFEAVMTTGSLSGAARKLGRAQPTIRKQIATLERELGVILFTRSETGLRPTERGIALLPAARAVIEEAAGFVRSAGRGGDVSGTVRITSSRVFAFWVLPDIVAELCAAHPQLRIELAPSDTVENLLRHAADVAVRLTPPDQAATVQRKVAAREIGLYAAPNVPFLPDQDTIAAHLATTPFVWEDRDDRLRRAADQEGWPVPARIAASTDDPLAQIALIRAGAGAGFVQSRIAVRLGLRRLAPDWSIAMPVWVVMHEDQATSAPVRAVFDGLVRALSPDR